MNKFCVLAPLLALALTAQAAPPVAEVQDVPEQLHGTAVNDPYRWMEDVKSPKAQAWMGAQGDATRSLLDRIDQRDKILARLAELNKASGDVARSVVRLPGERYWYLLRKAGENQFKLVLREGLNGNERVVADPMVESQRSGVPHAINHFSPSWDGRYVAYGISAGGSENATLHVIDVASGKPVAEPLPRVLSKVHWLPDSRALLANQLKQSEPGQPETEFYMDSRVLLLPVNGGNPTPVFGRTVTTGLGLDRLDYAELITEPGSRWVVARTTDTTVPEGKMYVAPVASLGRAGTRWRQISNPANAVRDVALRGEQLIVLTNDKAPRRKVVAVDLARGTLRNARTLVPQPASGVWEWMQPTKNGIVMGHRIGTAVVPERYVGGSLRGRPVDLPAGSAAWPVDAPAAEHDDLMVRNTGWTDPGRFLLIEGTRTRPAALVQEPTALAIPPITVRDVEFASHDGVKVPMTVLHRTGLALDGSNPVLLIGYASYGFSMTAGFRPSNIDWFERGGVIALVNARGSGVHGEAWHRAGFKATKRNTWLDGVAAARWLIGQGYGSPKTMTAMGTSAGGIFVGRATTAAPELFAAAIYDVGVLDAVRAEESANGITNISEFGSAKNPAEFKALLEMSTYHNIREGTAYPGVMLVHGMNDPRVDVWHSAKTAARLQAANTSGRPTLLRLDKAAGHGMGSTASQRDEMQADIHAFLLWQTGKLKLKD
jgi:prolyl oligopeptidase